MHLLIMIPDFF